MENGLPKSLSTVGGSRDNYTEYENDIDDGRYYRQQPRNITWRCTKDTTPSTVLLVVCYSASLKKNYNFYMDLIVCVLF